MKLTTNKGDLMLPDDFHIEITVNNPFLSNEGASSIPVRLPCCRDNLARLGFPDRPWRAARFEKKIPAHLSHGLFSMRGTLIIDSIDMDEGISCVFACKESEAYAAIQEKLLRDIFAGESRYFISQADGSASNGEINTVSHLWDLYTMENYGSRFPQLEGFVIFPIYTISQDSFNLQFLNQPREKGFDSSARIITDSSGNKLSLPEGYGVTPFIFLWKMLDLAFSLSGYSVKENIFRHGVLAYITVLNNCADSIVKGGFTLSDLVPSITMGELIIWLKDRFGAVCMFNGSEVRIRLIESCFNESPDIDLTNYAADCKSITYPSAKRIVFNISTDIEGAHPVADTLTDFTEKYSMPTSVGTPGDIPDTIDGLWFVRSTGSYYKRKSGVLTDIGSNAFIYDRRNATASEDISAIDQYPPMILSGNLLMPNVGNRVHRNSHISGEKNESETPIMICWACYEDGHWFGTSQMHKADGNQVRLSLPGPLTPEGVFSTFWKTYNSMLLNGAPEIIQQINLPVTKILSIDLLYPKLLNHFKVMIKSYSYSVSKSGLFCQEMSLLLLPDYCNAIEDLTPEFSERLTWQYINTIGNDSGPDEQIYEIIEEAGDGLADYTATSTPKHDPVHLGQIVMRRKRSRSITYVVDEGGSVNYADLRYYTRNYEEYFIAVTKVE